jgi:Trypsin-like peptidase domain
MTLSDTIDAIRPSVVQIMLVEPGAEDPSGPTGTGFFVSDDGYVISANHVLIEAEKALAEDDAGAMKIRIGVPFGVGAAFRGKFRALPFDVVDVDHRHDLALLQLHTNPFEGFSGASGRFPATIAPLDPAVDSRLGHAITSAYQNQSGVGASLPTVLDGQPLGADGEGQRRATHRMLGRYRLPCWLRATYRNEHSAGTAEVEHDEALTDARGDDAFAIGSP